MRFVIFLAIVLSSLSMCAQTVRSPFDGLTPKALEAGAPAGSYALSGFESVNLYNRSLSVAVPLLQIGGRGEAGYTMSVPLEYSWKIEGYVESGKTGTCTDPPCNSWHDVYGAYADFGGAYRPASIIARKTGSGTQPPPSTNTSCSGTAIFYASTLTRLTVRFADGSEVELRDTATGGQYASPDILSNCNPPVYPFSGAVNRGSTWLAMDGSATTFISDQAIRDNSYAGDPNESSTDSAISGTLYFRDGRQFRFENGAIHWIKDRNNNVVNFDTVYNSTAPTEVLTITDPLGRQTVVSMGYIWTWPGAGPYDTGSKDVITYKGAGGATRTINVYKRNYRFDVPAAPSPFPQYTDLFGYGDNQVVDGSNVSLIELPDSKTYKFEYTVYGEPAAVVLPTLARYEYLWEDTLGYSTTSADSYNPLNVAVLRRVSQRIEKADGYNVSRRTSYITSTETSGTENPLGTVTCGCTKVRVEDWDYTTSVPSLASARSDHYFYGVPADQANLFPAANTYSPWYEGREFRTDALDNSGAILRKKIDTWQQRTVPSWWSGQPAQGAQPAVDARVYISDQTIDGGKRSRRQTGFSTTLTDNSNNPIDVYEYDYGNTSGSLGSLLRQTHTDYFFDSGYNPVPVHLRSLPYLVTVKSGSGTAVAQTQYVYDESGGLLAAYSPAMIGNSPPTTTARGNVTTFQRLSGSGSVLQTTTAKYDVGGNVRQVTNPRGLTTSYSFLDSTSNGCGSQSLQGTYAFVTSITNPLSQTTNFEYDCNLGKQTKIVDVAGSVTTAQYVDPLDRVTKILHPTTVGFPGTLATSENSFVYDPNLMDLKTYQDQNSQGDGAHESRTLTDPLGRAIQSLVYTSKDGPSIVTSSTYDGLGRAKRTYNPGSATEWTEQSYDMLGRVSSTTYPDGSIDTTTYAGDTTTHTDAAGKAGKQRTDALGRLVEVTEDPAGSAFVTSYGYDTLDNLIAVTQGAQTRSFTYNALGQLVATTNPEVDAVVSCSGVTGTVSTCYTYDANGNLATQASGGVTATFAYDNLDRVLTKIYFDGTLTVTYVYDTVRSGCLTSVGNSYSSTSFTYGPGCQVLTSTQTTGGTSYSFQYGYNYAGALTKQQYPSGRQVSMSYDGAGRATSLCGASCSAGLVYANGFQYETGSQPYGLQTSMTLGNGLVESRQYNNRLQPTQIALGSVLTLVNCYQSGQANCSGVSGLASGNNGNVQAQKVNTAVRNYTYDALNRLTNAAQTSSWMEGYSYDRYGNRAVTTRTSPLPGLTAETPTVTSVYNAATNRITPFSYDQRGNVTAVPGRTTTYDGENRQITAVANSVSSTYAYDGEGRRVSKTVGGVTTVFVYDAIGQLAAEYGPAPAETGRQYFTTDHLGSTRLVTDAAGSVTKTLDYLPFGEELNVACSAAPGGVKFTGQVRDQETCEDYFKARYMSSAEGRFTTPDKPLVDQHSDLPQTWNLYTYTRNNPLKFVDETGTASIDYLRRVAVQMAWEQERALVQKTGRGTRDWSAEEIEILKNGGKPSGYEGHHINSVKGSPELAGEPDNIQFATQEEHFEVLHGGNTRIPTFGDLISRSLGALGVVQLFTSQFDALHQVQVTGTTESMSPFSFGKTYIVDPAKAAATLDGAYIQINGKDGGLLRVQHGEYIRAGCTDKPEKCKLDRSKLNGVQFEIVDPNTFF